MDKLDLLYDHYKNSYELSKQSQSDRNKLFIILTLIIALHFLFIIEPDIVCFSLYGWLNESFKINIAIEFSIIQSLLWFVLLYFTIRYYQVNTYIERQYNYLHKLEESISCLSGYEFNRESFNYLQEYPWLLDFISIIYRVIFPVLYLIVLCVKIGYEIFSSVLSLSLILDIILALCCLVLTLLYLLFLHKNYIAQRIKAWLHK